MQQNNNNYYYYSNPFYRMSVVVVEDLLPIFSDELLLLSDKSDFKLTREKELLLYRFCHEQLLLLLSREGLVMDDLEKLLLLLPHSICSKLYLLLLQTLTVKRCDVVVYGNSRYRWCCCCCCCCCCCYISVDDHNENSYYFCYCLLVVIVIIVDDFCLLL